MLFLQAEQEVPDFLEQCAEDAVGSHYGPAGGQFASKDIRVCLVSAGWVCHMYYCSSGHPRPEVEEVEVEEALVEEEEEEEEEDLVVVLGISIVVVEVSLVLPQPMMRRSPGIEPPEVCVHVGSELPS